MPVPLRALAALALVGSLAAPVSAAAARAGRRHRRPAAPAWLSLQGTLESLVASDGAAVLHVTRSSGLRRDLEGTDIELDLSRAAVHTPDLDVDGARGLDDLLGGDLVDVRVRRPRGGSLVGPLRPLRLLDLTQLRIDRLYPPSL